MVYRDSLTKNITILVVTVSGWGVYAMYTLLICCLRTSRPTKYVLRYSSNSAVFFKKSKRTWDFWNAPAISAQKDPLRFRDSPPHSALRSKRQNCLCRLFASNPLKKLQWKIFRDFAVDPHQTDKHFTFFLDWFIDIYIQLAKMQDFETIGSWQFQILPEDKPVFLENNTTGLFQDISKSRCRWFQSVFCWNMARAWHKSDKSKVPTWWINPIPGRMRMVKLQFQTKNVKSFNLI